MKEDLIQKIKYRASIAVREIERRPEMVREEPENIQLYRDRRYMDERNLENYYTCLPYLENCINMTKECKLLDIGCGKGVALSEIQEKYGCNVVGTTFDMLYGSELPIVRACACDLPFPDNTFDIVISVHGISWEPDQRKAMQEVVRVLKPGGMAHIYLITFGYSISLFVGNCFWKKNEYETYKKYYEFSPDIKIPEAKIEVRELQFPVKLSDAYTQEWQVFIKKDYCQGYSPKFV